VSDDRESLQTSASILQQNVTDMSKQLAQHAELFQRVAIHPCANFPGRTQKGLLPLLLRKKLEIPVENWVEEGRATQAKIDAEREKENDELWRWGREYMGERVARYARSGRNYTDQERETGIENVRTGLRRKLEDDEGSEEESNDEDEEMADVGLENTSVTVTKDGQVEFGMEELKATEKKPGGQVRRLSEIMRYVTTGDPARHYPTDRELDIAANKSMEFSPSGRQGFQNTRRA
jgi:mediator of RNA polymerase II transcription subunit 8